MSELIEALIIFFDSERQAHVIARFDSIETLMETNTNCCIFRNNNERKYQWLAAKYKQLKGTRKGKPCESE